jgi:hypothetical protein
MSHKIESITIIMVIDDQHNGDEAVPAMNMPNGTVMPLVASDIIRLEEMYKAAYMVCKQAGKQFRVLKFSVREDITDECRALYGQKQN